MKIKLYLETSIFGFYFDKLPHNLDKKESTIKLFNLIKDNYYDAFISVITLKEINNIPNKYNLNLLDFNNKDIENIEYLTNILINNKIVSENMLDDALHISHYIFSPANYLISWNCQHITNAKVLKEIKIILLNEGINKNIEMYTPMEVIYV